ncbi:hypothetical protein AB0L06_42995 [Spirillospora sp. NPDC052269]
MSARLLAAGITAAVATTVLGATLVPSRVIEASASSTDAPSPGAAAPATPSGAPSRGDAAPGDAARAERFTACMRSHGVPDFPGITVTGDGRVLLNLGKGTIDPISRAYRSAADACGHLLPAGSSLPGRPQPPKPPEPRLDFRCSGDACPVPPKPPTEPG